MDVSFLTSKTGKPPMARKVFLYFNLKLFISQTVIFIKGFTKLKNGYFYYFTASKASERSSIISSIFSVPIDNLIVFGLIPEPNNSSSVICE